jgi:hypothetical protein
MAMGTGLLALAMMAAEGPSCPPETATTFQVSVLSLDGLEWRTSSYPRLQPVARQGSSTVWTADRSLASSLAQQARSCTIHGKIITTTEAMLTRAETIHYFGSMDRYADGPVNQATAIAFLPKPERVDERFAIKASGRKLDQGILARIALEDTHVDVIHGIPQTETLKPPAAKTTRTPTELGRDIVNVLLPQNPRECSQAITCSVQVPEISQARVEGEWLIPNNGVLLVSLGVKTVADDQGKAIVRERLAVIEALSSTMPSASPGTAAAIDQPAPAAVARMAMPATPSRSLPRAIDPDGNAVENELPPLPEALASTELDRIKPAPYQPSPQAPLVSAPVRDAQLARTSFDSVPPAGKPAAEIEEVIFENRSNFLERVLDALTRAGLTVDIDVESRSPADRSHGPACEKCDGDEAICPAEVRTVRTPEAPGSLKLAPELSAEVGVTLKDAGGRQVFDADAALKEVFRTPGRTETRLIPLGGKIALEIKATVVPTSPERAKTAEKTADAPATPR